MENKKPEAKVREEIVHDLSKAKTFTIKGEPGFKIQSLKQKVGDVSFIIDENASATKEVMEKVIKEEMSKIVNEPVDETTLYKFITEWIDKALDQLWKDSKGSWLKIWNLSDYDKKIYDRQWAWWWLMSKFEPPIIWMWADLLEAITEHNKDEITDLAKYTPIIWKLLYYWLWDELWKETKWKNDEWNWGGEKKYDWWDDNKYDWWDKKEYNR